MTEPRLTLYLRDDCELCDLALLVLAEAGVADFHSVFIDGDAALESRYGRRVPVLCAGGELEWPFDARAVRNLIRPSDCRRVGD